VVRETGGGRGRGLSAAAVPADEWVAAPVVWGGAGEGTPGFLDGVRIFNPFQVGGFVGALNAEAVNRVTVLTGSLHGVSGKGDGRRHLLGRPRHDG